MTNIHSNINNNPTPWILIKSSRNVKKVIDAHQARRQNVIKVARDITVLAKKIIFSLHQLRPLNQEDEIPDDVKESIKENEANIIELLRSIESSTHRTNAYRYTSQLSGGLQEYIEAIAFRHFLVNDRTNRENLIITFEKVKRIIQTDNNISILITPEDYILGMFDFTGELMRLAITHMHDGSLINSHTKVSQTTVDVLEVLRMLKISFDSFQLPKIGGGSYWFQKNFNAKKLVFDQSLEKVEKAVYSMVLRGNEKPEGWMPTSSPESLSV